MNGGSRPRSAAPRCRSHQPEAHRLAGHYYASVNNVATAQAEFERALHSGSGQWRAARTPWQRSPASSGQGISAAARSYLQQALAEAPDEPIVLVTAAGQASEDRRFGEARQYLERLAKILPANGNAHADLAAARWNDGDHLAAAESVDRARELGAQREYFDSIESATRFQRWALRTAIVFGAAALALTAALAIIALIGLVLSRFQIQSLADAHAHLAANERTAAEALVNRIYAVVLWAAAVLLFVALPVLVVGTAGLGVAVLWAIFSMPFIPLKLVALVGIGTVLALYGLIRGLFLRRPPVSGRRLSRAEEPQLYRFLDEVAKAARSKPVDQVVLQPGPGVGVREEGSTLAVLTGRGRRVLELGYGAVQHLNIGELGSVLAHEYGHFSHGETRLTPLLRRVEVTAIQMVMGMAASGRIVLLNPAFWFLRWYMRVYVRITRGHGRRRELLADRVAALTYGGETFASALTNVSEAGEDLSRAMLLLGALRTVGVDAGTPYDLQTLKREETAKVLRAALASERKGQKSDPYDSHPPDAERIARVAGIRGSRLDDRSSAVHLLSNPEKLAAEVATDLVARLPALDPDAPRPLKPPGDVVHALSSLQDAYGFTKHGLPEALSVFEASVEELTRALGTEHPFLVERLRELAEARRKAGDEPGAEAALQRATAIEEREVKRRADAAAATGSA